MEKLWAKRRDVPAAERGRIIQRVLVDGWTPAQAAAAFGFGERQIARWVGEYRRRGMAALRDPLPRERLWARWRPFLSAVFGVGRGTRQQTAGPVIAACVDFRRGVDARGNPQSGSRRDHG